MNSTIKYRVIVALIMNYSISTTAYSAQQFTLQIGNNPVSAANVNGIQSNTLALSSQRAKTQAVHYKIHSTSTKEPQTQHFLGVNRDSVVVIGVDANGEELVNTVITDPRVIHAEVFKTNG